MDQRIIPKRGTEQEKDPGARRKIIKKEQGAQKNEKMKKGKCYNEIGAISKN